jgi:hypothetical protein
MRLGKNSSRNIKPSIRRPGEGRDLLFRLSEFLSNGNVVQTFVSSCRRSLDPGLAPG